MQRYHGWCLGLAWLVILGTPNACAADEQGQTLTDQAAGICDYTVRVIGFGVTTAPTQGPRNPDNRILNIACYSAALHLRPDFRLDLHDLTLSLQPRAELDWEAWTESPEEGDNHWRDETYIHQWLLRWSPENQFYISYGRENLQWGPACLTSLSNPFYFDNGRGNPKIEVQAMDFARLVWVPEVAWSISLIVNTEPGRNTSAEADFSPTWALKADYNGGTDYAGLIAACRENGRGQIGGFYGRTVSDGLLMSAEGAWLKNPAGRYPQRAGTPSGLAMRPADDRDGFRQAGLVGAAYTLATGPTLSVEYLYYGPGYDGAQAGRFFDLQESAAGSIDLLNAQTPQAYAALAQTADPGLRFLRRNYLMLQYLQNDIADAVDLTLRWTQNLDDGSGRLTAIGDWSLGDHEQLFIVGTLNRGSAQSEYGSIFDYQVMLGMEYTF